MTISQIARGGNQSCFSDSIRRSLFCDGYEIKISYNYSRYSIIKQYMLTIMIFYLCTKRKIKVAI